MHRELKITAKLAKFCGLLIDYLKNDSIFRTVLWSSHKSKRPTKSILLAEILAALESIDEGKQFVAAYREILDL